MHFAVRSQPFISQITGKRFLNGNLDVSLLTMERRHNARLGLIVRTLISVLLIVGMLYQIGSADVIGTLSTVLWPITALVAILASNVFFVTPRWQVILAALGYSIKMALLIGSVFLGFLFNQLLPTAVGGDVVRAGRAYDLGVPLAVAIYSVISELSTILPVK